MLPIPYNPIVILTEKRGSKNRTISLEKMGRLYIVAAFIQCAWPYLILTNWEIATQMLNIPILGWAFAALWVGMAWLIPHLIFIGYRLIKISRDPSVTIHQTEWEKKGMRSIAILLVLGILVDLFFIPVIIGVEDKGWIIFASGLIGGRVVQANMEAVLQYHRM